MISMRGQFARATLGRALSVRVWGKGAEAGADLSAYGGGSSPVRGLRADRRIAACIKCARLGDALDQCGCSDNANSPQNECVPSRFVPVRRGYGGLR